MTYQIVEKLRRKATWNDFDPATQDNFDEAAAHIEALASALEAAALAMTCHREDSACYCPNCDNSFYAARNAIHAALSNLREGQRGEQ